MTKNPMTQWIAGYQFHQPDAKPSDAWQHLVEVAIPSGIFPRLIGYDGEVTYRYSQRTEPRRLSKASFRRQFERARQRG